MARAENEVKEDGEGAAALNQVLTNTYRARSLWCQPLPTQLLCHAPAALPLHVPACLPACLGRYALMRMSMRMCLCLCMCHVHVHVHVHEHEHVHVQVSHGSRPWLSLV